MLEEEVTVPEKVAWRFAHRKVGAFFNVGDLILFGKYKNKKGRIVQFSLNEKGQPLVEIEPIPKGRKQNKLMGLFKIWNVAAIEKAIQKKEANMDSVAEQVASRFASARSVHAEEAAPADANTQWNEFNTKLAKLMQKLKKDAGAEAIAQNYKGTGSKAYRRQLWIHFTSGAVIDLWLDNGFMKFGGVVKKRAPGAEGRSLPETIKYEKQTPEQVYAEAAKHLKEWGAPEKGKEASMDPVVGHVAARFVVAMGIPLGKTWEAGSARIHRYRDHFRVTDLENAGKRGKKVREMTLAPTYAYKGNPDDWMESMSKALPDYHSYDQIKAFIKDVLHDHPGEIRIDETFTRGVDVNPGGTTKIRLTTSQGLEITADPLDFMVKTHVPLTHPKSGEPIGFQDTLYSPSNARRDSKVFYNWLTANLVKAEHMTIEDFRKLWDDLKIPYTYH